MPAADQAKEERMGQKVRDVMTSNPQTIAPHSPVTEAARIMKQADTGIVPVVEGDRLVGTITDRDIAIRVVAESRDPQGTKVDEIASREIVTVDPDQDLDEALKLMARHQVRRLPVVEEDGRPVGMLSQADVARESKDSKTGKLVEEISK
jgi:CBS domain-containing protein